MDIKLEKYLIKKYPKMFPQEEGANFIFECDDGWFTLIDNLAGILQGYIDYEMTAYEDRRQALLLQQTTSNPNHQPNSWLETDENGMVIVPPMPQQIVATQVKQKFGELRFYIEGHSIFADNIIQSFTRMSKKICEVCGKPGKITQKEHYIQPLCPEHDTQDKSVEIKPGATIEFLMDGNTATGQILKVLNPHELLVLYKKLDYGIFENEGKYYKVSYVDHPLHAYWDGEPSELIE